MTGSIGDTQYTFLPEHPNGHEEFRVRIDTGGGCFAGSVTTATNIGKRELTLDFYFSDSGPPACPQSTPFFRTFGVVPPGDYTLIVDACGSNLPPPAPFCEVVEVRQIEVGGGEPSPVPATTDVTLALMIALVAAVASMKIPRLRRQRREQV